MHPVIVQQLAAEPIKAMVTQAGVARRPRQARLAWRARTSAPVAWPARPGPPITQDESAQLSAR